VLVDLILDTVLSFQHLEPTVTWYLI